MFYHTFIVLHFPHVLSHISTIIPRISTFYAFAFVALQTTTFVALQTTMVSIPLVCDAMETPIKIDV